MTKKINGKVLSKGVRRRRRKIKETRRRALELLTPVERSIIDIIIKCIKNNHRPPTLREMAKAMGWHHTRAAQIVNKLVLKGYIKKDADASRGIRLNSDIYEVVVIER